MLDREVLSTTRFMSYAQPKLMLVELDFPRGGGSRVPQRTQSLARRFGVKILPTVVLVSDRGKELGRVSYRRGSGPQAFIAALEKHIE